MATTTESRQGARSPARLGELAASARNWALCLVAAGLLFKLTWILWCVADGALDLRPWEWLALPLIGSYQHLLFGLICFALYFVLLLPCALTSAWRRVGLLLLGGLQVTGVLYLMTALRMSLLLGTPPTFGLLQAGAQGGVIGSSLIRPENLPYTLGGAAAAALVVFASLALDRRWPRWPRRSRLATALLVLVLWSTGGVFSEAQARSELHNAPVEPLSFLLIELLQQRAEREGGAAPGVEDPGDFRRELLFGDDEPEATSRAFRELERWRRTNRNVVLVVLESVQADNASFHGPVEVHGEVRDTTPLLASLRENMLVMENHYAVHPTSMADLFSIACSLYPYPLRPPITEVNPTIPCGSMPERLVEAGYSAGLFHSGHFSFWRKDLFFADRGFEVMVDAESMPGREGAFEYNWGVDERVTARAIAGFIHDHRDRPFFVQYIPVFPHAPYSVPDPSMEVFGDGSPLDRYHNSLRYVDQSLGIIVDALRAEELLDDTLLVVVADHGEAFGEHPGNRCHSAFVYDENVHVPFGIYNPVLFQDAPTISRVTSHVDLLPTLADLLELAPTPSWQGRSLLEDGPSRLAYFYSVSGRQLVGLRDGQYKVIWNRETGAVQIFDLERDPEERHDLSAFLRDRVGAYQRALTGWRSHLLALIPRFGQQPEAEEGRRWLADLRPLRSYQPHPYDPVADHAVSGRDLTIGSVAFDRGLGTHADSWYTYDVDALDALRLVGRVGRDSRMRRGSAEAAIFLDGRLAFASGTLRAGTGAIGFDLDLQGVREVSLLSSAGLDGSRSDHVSWAEVALLTSPELVLEHAERPDRRAPRTLLQGEPERVFGLALLPPAPPGPDDDEVGWGRTPAGSPLELDGEAAPQSLWLRPDATLRYRLEGLGARRLAGRLTALGPERCRASLVVNADDVELLESVSLSPGGTPLPFDLDVAGRDELVLDAHGSEGCALILEEPRLVSD